MNLDKLWFVLDKNVNQEQLAKDIGIEIVMPFLEAKLAGVDLIPGTQIDNKILMEVLAFLKKQLE